MYFCKRTVGAALKVVSTLTFSDHYFIINPSVMLNKSTSDSLADLLKACSLCTYAILDETGLFETLRLKGAYTLNTKQTHKQP